MATAFGSLRDTPTSVGVFARSSRSGGFTLVELVIVVILLAVLSAVALPRLFSASAFDARGYHDELLSAARYAQKLAVASRCSVRLSIAAGGGYSLNHATPCGSGTYTTAVTRPDRTGDFAGTPPAGVSVTSGTGNVVFASDGSADTDRTVRVEAASFAAEFRIHAATGLVQPL